MKRIQSTVLRTATTPVRGWLFGAVMLFSMLCLRLPVCAQSEMDEMSASGLLSAATRALEVEKYDAAIPFLDSYLVRMEFTEDKRVWTMMQDVRLKLAKIYAFKGDSAKAADFLNQYIEGRPLYKPREAYRLLALNLYKEGQYEDCIVAATNALAGPLPLELDQDEQAADYDQLNNDERAGFTDRQLRRLDEEQQEAAEKEGIAKGFSSKAPDPELDYTVDELVMLHLTIGDAYSALEQWEKSLESYQFVIDNALEEDRQGYAIMQTVTALVNLTRFKEAGVFVTQLYRTNARYDVRVNIAMMSAAKALFVAEEYDSALKLFRMVMPRQELVAYQEKKMNEVRRSAGLPDVEISIATNQTGGVETLFGNRVSEMTELLSEEGQAVRYPPKPPELEKMEEAVRTVVGLGPYEDDVLYFSGMIYSKAGRPWEAIAVFDEMIARDPYGDRGTWAFAEKLRVLLVPLAEYDLVEQLATEYLATYTEGIYPRQVALTLISCYRLQDRWKDVKGVRPTVDGFTESDDPDILKCDCELYYMMAVADMMLMKYSDAKDEFAKILNNYPNSHQQANCILWTAMCDLYLQNYESGLEWFQKYIETYSDSEKDGLQLASAAFHSGICLFGLERYEEAEQQFAFVIENYKENSIYPDACSMHGDLLAAKEPPDLDGAQHNYEEAIAAASDVKQATYAVFQMVTMFDLNSGEGAKYTADDIIALIDSYTAEYGEQADLAKAAYWRGKTKLSQGLVEDAIASYFDTIITYGADVKQAGVDDIIPDLVRVARYKVDDNQRLELVMKVNKALGETDSATLKLRLRVLLASINGTKLELGKQLIGEIDDLSQAPPPVLSVICDASFEEGDYSRAAEIIELFITRYENSDFTASAYKLSCYDLFSQGRYMEAGQAAEAAQGLYGAGDSKLAWAQIMRGRVATQYRNFTEAKTLLETVLQVREWRGVAYAEAMYYLGEAAEAASELPEAKAVDPEEAIVIDFENSDEGIQPVGVVEDPEGKLRQAFVWYQRTYMQYKSYANGYWAAEAYLASARCLEKLSQITTGSDKEKFLNDRRNTYRAMLYDKFVNTLPQADAARAALGAAEAQEIDLQVAGGIKTNLTISIEEEKPETPAAGEPVPAVEETQE